jgi:UDP-glucose 4-epimerase
VFIDDIARANVLAVAPGITDEVFNIASGTETSLAELATMLLKVMGSDLEVEHGPERRVNKVSRRLADVAKARELLGWTPAIGLEEGLTRLVAWWRAEREVNESLAQAS